MRVRSLLAVPGRYIFAVLKDFFYSLVHFYPQAPLLHVFFLIQQKCNSELFSPNSFVIVKDCFYLCKIQE